jgi:hypothetical protein
MKDYIEIAFHKGDLDKEGATLRMGEMRVLTKVFAALNKGQYSEDTASYAAIVPAKNLPVGGVKEFKDNVLNKVDIVGYFSDAEFEKKAKKMVQLATDGGYVLSLDLIKNRANHYIMEKYFSIREWRI